MKNGGKNYTEDDTNQTLKITRHLSNSNKIVETERHLVTAMPDGTMKTSVIKETYANVTTRKKAIEGKANENPELTYEAKRKRTMSAESVINHLSENNTDQKAEMVSRIIDREGKSFAETNYFPPIP